MDVEGRLVGGCIETLADVAGDEPQLVFGEACEGSARAFCRRRQPGRRGRYASQAVLVGRARPRPPRPRGHVRPFLPPVNGARRRVVHDGVRSQIVQTFG
ncbi:hypothetical protein AB5J52_15635 [Streptomyces sp. R39]|uniref:Uncharacterized protein n=1 Tax=Streptomyces sp. R39 TaxID=3238631 RepID=A0AB39QRQ8_9ACTN